MRHLSSVYGALLPSEPAKVAYLQKTISYFVVLPGAILLSAMGAYSSMEIAINSRRSLAATLAERNLAVTNFPWSAEYQSRLADLQRANGLPFTAVLRAAARNSPADSRLWIELGLAQEADGDTRSAETSFLRAGTLGRDYDTLWSLANFYFRRADRAQSLAWSCAVLNIPGVEVGPVFSLLSNFPQQPACLVAESFKGPPSARRGYLEWLISKGELDAAGPVAAILVKNADPETVHSLLDYSDRLLLAGKAEPAARLWSSMASQHLVSAAVLETGALFDGELRLDDPPHGFAWRTTPVQGADIVFLHPGWQVSLFQTLPERCELLSQWVILRSGFHHVLHYRFAASGMTARSGVHWEITSPAAAGWLNAAEQASDLSAGASSDAYIRFQDPAKGNLIRVALVYQRTPTAEPARGWIRMEKVWLTD